MYRYFISSVFEQNGHFEEMMLLFYHKVSAWGEQERAPQNGQGLRNYKCYLCRDTRWGVFELRCTGLLHGRRARSIVMLVLLRALPSLGA